MPSEAHDRASCPAVEPADGTGCPIAGLSCRYGNDPLSLSDHLCTAQLTWSRREYSAPPDAEADDFGIVQPALVSCISKDPSCPTTSSQCVVACCGGGGAGAGCAGCCREQACELLPATECPAERCHLRRGCGDIVVCSTPRSPTPACGVVGDYGAACCEGLVETCDVLSTGDGSCLQDFGYNRLPICLACGDGLCELGVENNCNCPADCP